MLPNLLLLLKPLQSFLEAWLKRPRLHVEVVRIHAKPIHIFRDMFFESGLADVMAHDDTIGAYPGFENYLCKYTEVGLVRASEAPLVVTKATAHFADGSARSERSLRTVVDGAFSSVSLLATEPNYPHRLYLSEETFPQSRIVSVEVEDALGRTYATRHIADESELRADNEDVDGFDAFIDSALRSEA